MVTTHHDRLGRVAEVDGLLPGESFGYVYTRRGEVTQLSAMEPVPDAPTPRQLREYRTYDADGSLTEHTDVAGLGVSAEAMRHEKFTVDPVGRVLGSEDDVSWGIAILPTESSFTYSGLAPDALERDRRRERHHTLRFRGHHGNC